MRSVFVILTIESFLVYRGTDLEKIVTFTSEKTGPTGTIGLFQSPGYPYSSTNENFDREYHFIGRTFDSSRRIFERVQIRFDNFNLYKKNPLDDCNEVEDSVLSYAEPSLVLICGQRLPLPILSDSSRFILRYESKQAGKDFITDENSLDLHRVYGFNATYRFVTNYGIDTGVQIPQNDCEFEFKEEVEPSGSFYSPNFPGYYPKSKTCVYYFEGVSSPYLRLNFTNFNLQVGTGDCRPCGVHSPFKDNVDLKATDSGDSQFFCERKCGSVQPFVVTVNATYFVVSFESTSYYVGDDTIRFPPPESIGFFATYEFTNSTVEDGLKIASASAAIKIMTYIFVVVAVITMIIVVLIVMRTYLS